MDNIIKRLKAIKHPRYKEAKALPYFMTWSIQCESCKQIHKINIDTLELDPCCDNQDVGYELGRDRLCECGCGRRLSNFDPPNKKYFNSNCRSKMAMRRYWKRKREEV